MADGKPKYKSHWDPNSKQQVAQSKVRQAVKAGRLDKPHACQTCGNDALLVGHHWRGYDYPLDVWWICISCNIKLNRHDGSVSISEARRKMGGTKTDNSNPHAKLDLRRYFLRKYHADTPPDVLDCCQGGGLLWTKLREEFETRSYWGVDLKKKKGRVKLDSVRILQQPGWPQNVIDVDTYGSPWKHWEAMLPNITQPTTVFLTIGKPTVPRAGGRSLSALEYRAMGCEFDIPIPRTFGLPLAETANMYCLAVCRDFVTLDEAVEAASIGDAKYLGVRVSPLADEETTDG